MESTLAALLMAVLAAATFTDLRSSRIPNSITFSVMGIGPIVHGCLAGFQGILFSLEGIGVGLGLFLLLYASGGIGAGDVKLMGAVGAIVGPYGALTAGLLTILIGGVYAFSAMCYQWGVAATTRKFVCATHGAILHGPGEWSKELRLPFKLRYGLAIVGGTLLFLLGVHPFGE
jgi:prepilin peptidase CpaA